MQVSGIGMVDGPICVQNPGLVGVRAIRIGDGFQGFAGLLGSLPRCRHRLWGHPMRSRSAGGPGIANRTAAGSSETPQPCHASRTAQPSHWPCKRHKHG